MYDHATHAQLARLEHAGMPDRAAIDLMGLYNAIAFCDAFGQLLVLGPVSEPLGFIAWLRCEPEHLQAFRDRDLDQIGALSTGELTQGRCLVIMETWCVKPRLSAIAARGLSHLPGVERLAAYTWGGNPKSRRWRERPVHGRTPVRRAA
jgi:hypothetical protein